MREKEVSSLVYWLFYFIGISVAGFIIYPLFDMLWATFVSRSPFEYTIQDHIISPIVFACIMSTIYTIFRRKNK